MDVINAFLNLEELFRKIGVNRMNRMFENSGRYICNNIKEYVIKKILIHVCIGCEWKNFICCGGGQLNSLAGIWPSDEAKDFIFVVGVDSSTSSDVKK